jgi:secreted protein with Ig-like and vWFA domain
MNLERPTAPTTPATFGAVLSVLAPKATEERAPIRLVAVLDKSGSMRGEKLRLCVACMRLLLPHLLPRDELGIVLFDTQVKVLSRMVACDAAGRALLEDKLNQVASGSQTNLSGGLLQGFKLHADGGAPDIPVRMGHDPDGTIWVEGEVQEVQFCLPDGRRELVSAPPFRATGCGEGTVTMRVTAGGSTTRLQLVVTSEPTEVKTAFLPRLIQKSDPCVRSTLLFTDGMANHGIRDPAAIIEAACSELKQLEMASRPCTLHTFGFGADHNAELLRGLAEAGGGSYSYIEREDGITDAFAESMGGLLSQTHQAVELRVDAPPGVVWEPRTAFDVSTTGNTLTITLGDLLAEDHRDVYFDVTVPAGTSRELGVAALTGFSFAEKKTEKTQLHMQVSREDLPEPLEEPAPDVVAHRNRHIATAALDEARRRGAAGDIEASRVAIDAAIGQIQQAPPAVVAACAGVLEGLRDCKRDMANEQSYRSVGSKKLAMYSHMHGKQRACGWQGDGMEDTMEYSNTIQKSMKAVFKARTTEASGIRPGVTPVTPGAPGASGASGIRPGVTPVTPGAPGASGIRPGVTPITPGAPGASGIRLGVTPVTPS